MSNLYEKRIGTREEVFAGIAIRTSGHLRKEDLAKDDQGNVILNPNRPLVRKQQRFLQREKEKKKNKRKTTTVVRSTEVVAMRPKPVTATVPSPDINKRNYPENVPITIIEVKPAPPIVSVPGPEELIQPVKKKKRKYTKKKKKPKVEVKTEPKEDEEIFVENKPLLDPVLEQKIEEEQEHEQTSSDPNTKRRPAPTN